MIGVLVLAHGALGEALVDSATHVLGRAPAGLRQLAVSGRDDPEAVYAQAADLVRDLDKGEGVVILTDIYGATPGNVALRLLRAGRVEGVSGVSLPMLVRVLTYRDRPLATVVQKALTGGTEGVVHMTTDPCNGCR